jgi:hypothetical protein
MTPLPTPPLVNTVTTTGSTRSTIFGIPPASSDGSALAGGAAWLEVCLDDPPQPASAKAMPTSKASERAWWQTAGCRRYLPLLRG